MEGDASAIEGLKENEWFGTEDDSAFWLCGFESKSCANRRSEYREHAHIEVRIEPGGQKGTINDISVGGVLVYSERTVPPSTIVDMTITSDLGNIKARGLVRWLKKGSIHDLYSNKIGMGVQFLWVETKFKYILCNALHTRLADLRE